MRLRHLSLFVIFSLCLFLCLSSVAQTPRDWSKRHATLYVDGELHAQWTRIYTADEESPYVVRLLYEDEDAALLVIRTNADVVDPAGETVITIEHLGTSELLTITKQATAESVTYQLGASQTTVDYATVVAAYGVNGRQFTVAQKTDAQTVLGNASQGFQAAIRRLTNVGCYESLEMFRVGVLFGHLFYEDIDCDPPRERATYSNVTLNFDPDVTPPGVFEQQFGDAYYE